MGVDAPKVCQDQNIRSGESILGRDAHFFKDPLTELGQGLSPNNFKFCAHGNLPFLPENMESLRGPRRKGGRGSQNQAGKSLIPRFNCDYAMTGGENGGEIYFIEKP
jgi:hypothetical protein